LKVTKLRKFGVVFLICLLLFVHLSCFNQTNTHKPEKLLLDQSHVIPNPKNVPTILFDTIDAYPKKTFPIQRFYPVDPAVHPYTVISPEYFITPLEADGLFSYSRKTGKLLVKYKRPSESGYMDHQVYKNYFVYLLAMPDRITCHRIDSGKQVWEYDLKDVSDKSGWSFVKSSDDLVLLQQLSTSSNEFGNYIALDGQTGKYLWKIEAPSFFAFEDKGLLIFYTEGKLIKFNSKSKEVIWKSPGIPSPAENLSNYNQQYFRKINDQILFYIAQDSLYLINAIDGSVINKRSHTPIQFALEEYQYDQNHYFDLSTEHILTCYETQSLAKLWSLQLSSFQQFIKITDEESLRSLDTKLIFHQGKLFITLSLHSTSFTYCIHPENGKVDWIKPYKIDHFLNGYGIRENKQQDEGTWNLAKSLNMIDLKDGNEVWYLNISNQYYSPFYIDLGSSLLLLIRNEKDNKEEVGLLKISYKGEVEALYKNNMGNVGYINEFSNKDKTSLFFGGEYNNSSCYFEVDKSVFEK
jgi:outer membrane protein assembly factor BamB